MEWISVKDRLPKIDERVLGYAIPNKEMSYYIGCHYFECYICDEKWYEFVDGCEINVTHWMPLPEPPKKE